MERQVASCCRLCANETRRSMERSSKSYQVWSEASVRNSLKGRMHEQGKADLGDALDALFRELGILRSLKEVGVGGGEVGGVGGGKSGR